MNDDRDTPTHPGIHPDLHDDVTEEATSPGGRAIPPPPPNGRIDGAPEWARRLESKLDEVLGEQKALRVHVDELLGARRGELRRLTELEQRVSEHEELHAEAAYAGANGAAG